jgi:hypothetical protein
VPLEIADRLFLHLSSSSHNEPTKWPRLVADPTMSFVSPPRLTIRSVQRACIQRSSRVLLVQLPHGLQFNLDDRKLSKCRLFRISAIDTRVYRFDRLLRILHANAATRLHGGWLAAAAHAWTRCEVNTRVQGDHA